MRKPYRASDPKAGRLPGSGIVPPSRSDGSCLGRLPEEDEEDGAGPVPTAPADPADPPVDPGEPTNPG